MSLFAIADTHLSISTGKTMNIFQGWSDYEERLEKNWCGVVKDEDTVVIAGDITWAMNLEQALPDFQFINSLPGKKIILKGNHDYWWSTRKKANDFFALNGIDSIQILHNNAFLVGNIAICGTRGWFFDAEADADKKIILREAGRLKTSIAKAREFDAEPVVFLHYPPLTQVQECEEIYNVLIEENIQRCYYGHLHGQAIRGAFNGERSGIKFGLISGDFLEFCPKLIERC